jgi:hypothetical protein
MSLLPLFDSDKSISAYTDPTCTNCVKTGGKCYDADEDYVRDGCICPVTRSSSVPHDYSTDCDTSDCKYQVVQFMHVQAACNLEQVTWL